MLILSESSRPLMVLPALTGLPRPPRKLAEKPLATMLSGMMLPQMFPARILIAVLQALLAGMAAQMGSQTV
jgi:hypothetical protein